MSVPNVRRILNAAYNHKVRKWFTTDIPAAVNKVVSAYQTRNEVIGGGTNFAAGASIAAGALAVDIDGIDSVLNGKIKAAVAALDDDDLLASPTGVGTPLFSDGADAAALSLATDETAYCTLIVTNSDDAGGAVDTDAGDPLLVLLIAGTSSTYAAQTGHLSSEEIKAALEASTEHTGLTGWAHVLRFVFDENSASPQVTGVTLNRNNHLNA